MADRANFTVRLIDKVKGPARSAEKAMGRLRMANGRFAKGSGGVEKAAGRFKDASGKLREANGRFVKGMGKGGSGGGGLGGMWDVFKGNLLTAAASRVAALAGDLAHAGAEMVTFGQNTRLALGNLAKHDAVPERLFVHARALATRFGLDLMDTTDQYKKFLALQFTPKAADKLIKMGADLRALGTDAEGVQGVFMALGQIKGKGKLQGEEMLQLAERGISTMLVQEEIGKLMGGKTTAQVQKLQQAGKVTADIGLQAIENAINRKLGQNNLGESGAKFADQTIDGMLGRIKAIGQDAGVTLVDKITAPVTKMIGKGLDVFESFIVSPEGVATIDKIATAFGQAADFVSLFADNFGAAFGTTFESNVKPLFEAFGMFSDGDSTAKALGKSLGEVAAFSVAAVAGIGLLGGAVAKVLGPIYEVGKAILVGLIDPLAKIGADFYMWIEGFSEVLDNAGLTLGQKAWELGKMVVTGLGNGISAMVSYPVDAIMGVGSEVIDAVRGIFDSHSPSRVTMSIGRDVGRGLAIGTDRSSRLVAAAGTGLATSHLGGMFDGYMGPEMSSVGSSPLDSAPASARSGDVTVTITQNIDGAAGNAEEVGRIAARESRRELEAFFRQLNAEAG